MKKKNINSVSLNATTLDHQPASYYDLALVGLKPRTISKSNIDLNDMTEAGYYDVGGLITNRPSTVSGVWIFLTVIVRAEGQTMQQLTTIDANSPQMFFRTQRGGVWSAWKQVATI